MADPENHSHNGFAGRGVYLLDDHEVVRRGLRQLIESNGLGVAGESGSAREAVRRIPALGPELVILDDDLPDGSGADVCHASAAADPGHPLRADDRGHRRNRADRLHSGRRPGPVLPARAARAGREPPEPLTAGNDCRHWTGERAEQPPDKPGDVYPGWHERQSRWGVYTVHTLGFGSGRYWCRTGPDSLCFRGSPVIAGERECSSSPPRARAFPVQGLVGR